jgi:hypothetical protein
MKDVAETGILIFPCIEDDIPLHANPAHQEEVPG